MGKCACCGHELEVWDLGTICGKGLCVDCYPQLSRIGNPSSDDFPEKVTSFFESLYHNHYDSDKRDMYIQGVFNVVPENIIPVCQAALSDVQNEIDLEKSNIEAARERKRQLTGIMYDLQGARGRRLLVYKDKCIFQTRVSVGSILTDSATNGEKVVYYADCIGVQFKNAGLTLGYLQLETASGMVNGTNAGSNFFSENTFTFDANSPSNRELKEAVAYIRGQIDKVKNSVASPNSDIAQAYTAADAIRKFKELLDIGAITEEEFNAKKKQLLNL